MWPGRGQREGDELCTYESGLASIKNSIPRENSQGGQETGTSKVAENQRKKKNWQFCKGQERGSKREKAA